MTILPSIKRFFHLFNLTLTLAVIASILLAILSFMEFQSNQCADRLAEYKNDYQRQYFQFITLGQYFYPALLSVASTTNLSDTGSFSLSVSPKNEKARDAIMAQWSTENNNISTIDQFVIQTEQQCDNLSSGVQILLYFALAFSVLSGVSSEFAKRWRETYPKT